MDYSVGEGSKTTRTSGGGNMTKGFNTTDDYEERQSCLVTCGVIVVGLIIGLVMLYIASV